MEKKRDDATNSVVKDISQTGLDWQTNARRCASRSTGCYGELESDFQRVERLALLLSLLFCVLAGLYLFAHLVFPRGCK